MAALDWDFRLLESLIEQRGDEVIHELGVACPCRQQSQMGSLSYDVNQQPATVRRLDCDQCGGTGWLYRDAKIIKGLVTGVEAGRNRSLMEFGYAVPGDAVFSPSLRTVTMSDFDRITLMYPVPVNDGQVILRNVSRSGDIAMLRTGLSPDQDRLWYQADNVYWCEDENGVLYTQDVDFTVDEKVITWTANRPADGVAYVVKYDAFLEWVVYSTPLTRFDRDRSLAQRVLLRKVHVAFLNDYEFDTATKRQEKEISFTSKTKI